MKVNKLLTFNYTKPKSLRACKDTKQQVWFVSKDVCNMLGIKNNKDAIKSLDDDEKKLGSVLTTSASGVEQTRQMSLVNESGLYHIIFLSRKPSAKQLRKWVTNEVLPQIRKTGKYTFQSRHQYSKLRQSLFEEIREKIQYGDSYKINKELNIPRAIITRFVHGYLGAMSDNRCREVLDWLNKLNRQPQLKLL